MVGLHDGFDDGVNDGCDEGVEWRLAILMVCSTVEHLDRHSAGKRGNLTADRMGPWWEQLKERCSVAYLDSKTASLWETLKERRKADHLGSK